MQLTKKLEHVLIWRGGEKLDDLDDLVDLAQVEREGEDEIAFDRGTGILEDLLKPTFVGTKP